MLEPTIARLLEMDVAGELPWFAWPGGYNIVYIDGWNNELCSECANKALQEKDENTFTEDLPQDWYIHHEGDPALCYECNKEIESAYGNPEGDE